MPKALLSVSHLKQRRDSDCLAACTAMVLNYLGVQVDYDRLLTLLNIRNYGAPAGNIRAVSVLGLQVNYSVSDLDGLVQLIDKGIPIIAFVRTGDLPYWEVVTDHAVVVAGYDTERGKLTIHDPYFTNGPFEVPSGDFELAWLERDFYFATVQRAD